VFFLWKTQADVLLFFSPACGGPAFGRSAHVRKPRPARQPLRFRPAPAHPLPAPPRRIPPRRPPAPAPAAQIDVSPAWISAVPPRSTLFVAAEGATSSYAGANWNAISHTSPAARTSNIQHVVGRVRYTNVASVEQRCPWGARRQLVL
jgi:hypothetical protein